LILSSQIDTENNQQILAKLIPTQQEKIPSLEVKLYHISKSQENSP